MALVKTHGGDIKGYTKEKANYFLGIPYANQLINEHRFKRSKCLKAWENIIKATLFKSMPPRPYNKLETFFSLHAQLFDQSEDCLYLNIWCQNNQYKNKPIIIYFYGGGSVNGHDSQELYTPEHIVEQLDIIVTTFNYRLGALGFLDWSYFDSDYNKNDGLSGQISALKWVHTLIKHFGGNSNNTTLIGQSAGSMSIMASMQRPELDKYCHQVMLLSGTLHLDSHLLGQKKAAHFAYLKDTYFPKKRMTHLTTLEISSLMSYNKTSRGKSRGLGLIYTSVQESDMSHPLPQFTKPVAIGTTKEEGSTHTRNESRKLSPGRFVEVMTLSDIHLHISQAQTGKDQVRMATMHHFGAPATSFLSQLNNSLYCQKLRFDQCLSNVPLFQSAYHILDLVLQFGKLEILKAYGMNPLGHKRHLSKHMIDDLIYSATYCTMSWPPYSPQTPYCYIYKQREVEQ